MADEKAEGAFRTIGELSDEFGLPQHILRYWETKFPQLRPLQRAGNRRYYRTADVALVKRIDGLLNREGYTVKGVQKLLAAKGGIAVVHHAHADDPIRTACDPRRSDGRARRRLGEQIDCQDQTAEQQDGDAGEDEQDAGAPERAGPAQHIGTLELRVEMQRYTREEQQRQPLAGHADRAQHG
jgi:DNA-binding transcriptional MerR regulator